MSEVTAPASTEDTILAGIDAAEDGMVDAPYGDAPSEPPAPSQETTEGSTEAAQQQPTDQQTDQTVAKSGEQQPTDTTDQPKQVKSDQDGNLVNAETGEIIAGRGAERRVFERAQRVQEQNQRLEGMLREQAQKIDDLSRSNALPQQLGLSGTDVETGLRVVAQFKSNPILAAQHVIAEAMKLGHSLESIVGKEAAAGGSNLDMTALNAMIDEKLKPVMDVHRAGEEVSRNAEIERQAELDYNRFLNQHEYADVHEDAIARLMQSTNVAPEVAYWQIKNYATANGLDFTQPLQPQVIAKQSGTPAPTPSNGASPQAQPPKPIPTGTSGGTGIVPSDTHQKDASLDANSDIDEIVMQAMRESGMG